MEKCLVCGAAFSVEWTDLHGEATCLKCGVPYQILHYDENNNRKEAEPILNIQKEFIPMVHKYWEEFHKHMGLGLFLGSPRYPENYNQFMEWIELNPEYHEAEKKCDKCKGTGKLNRPAAVKDYNLACRLAGAHGRTELTERIPDSFGVKRIDTKTCKLLIQIGVSKESAKSMGYECCYQWEKAAKQLKAQQNKRLQSTRADAANQGSTN